MFGLFAGEVAAGVEGVDADVEERAAASELLVETPFAGRDIEAEGAFDGLDLTQRAVANEFDGAEVGGLVVAAVGDHELDVGGFAGGDHGSQSATVVAMGFSQRTCLPALAARMVYSACMELGRAT